MNEKQFFAVILAGGKGERFWPYSTSRTPKQLLNLVGGKPMLALAVERLEGLLPADHVYVITNADLVDACRAAAPGVPRENVIGEPIGRDTAAAIAAGAALIKARAPGAAFCVLTADHLIGDLDVFRRTLRESLELALREDVLITIGIKPRGPETGYGYIEAGASKCEAGGVSFLAAKRFVEKPDAARAKEYVDSGRYFWNSGMFIWSVAALEKALTAHRPQLADLIAELSRAGRKGFASALAREYDRIEKISVDYALMEKASNIVMVRGDFRWDDVGSWTALADHLPRDAAGNAVAGACEAMDSRNNIVMSEGRLTALIGVEDLVVVHTENATLVCSRDRVQDVKKLVHQLAAGGKHSEVL